MTIEAVGSVPASVMVAELLDEEALVVGADGCELDVGTLVVGEVGAVVFGALGRPFPLPCAFAFTASAITRPIARAPGRGSERFVTMPLVKHGRGQRGKGKLTLPSPFTFDFDL